MSMKDLIKIAVRVCVFVGQEVGDVANHVSITDPIVDLTS